MEAARYSETLVNFYQTTRRYNPDDSHLHLIPNLHLYFEADHDDDVSVSCATIIFAIALITFNKHFRRKKLFLFQFISVPHFPLFEPTSVYWVVCRGRKCNLAGKRLSPLHSATENSSNAHFHVKLHDLPRILPFSVTFHTTFFTGPISV
jgi:hypothetical protein